MKNTHAAVILWKFYSLRLWS